MSNKQIEISRKDYHLFTENYRSGKFGNRRFGESFLKQMNAEKLLQEAGRSDALTSLKKAVSMQDASVVISKNFRMV
jgi:hypothetical protein